MRNNRQETKVEGKEELLTVTITGKRLEVRNRGTEVKLCVKNTKLTENETRLSWKKDQTNVEECSELAEA